MRHFFSRRSAPAFVALTLLAVLQLGGVCSWLGRCALGATPAAQAPTAGAASSCPDHPAGPATAWVASDCCGLLFAVPPIEAVAPRHVVPPAVAAELTPIASLARDPGAPGLARGSALPRGRPGSVILLEIQVLLL